MRYPTVYAVLALLFAFADISSALPTVGWEWPDLSKTNLDPYEMGNPVNGTSLEPRELSGALNHAANAFAFRALRENGWRPITFWRELDEEDVGVYLDGVWPELFDKYNVTEFKAITKVLLLPYISPKFQPHGIRCDPLPLQPKCKAVSIADYALAHYMPGGDKYHQNTTTQLKQISLFSALRCMVKRSNAYKNKFDGRMITDKPMTEIAHEVGDLLKRGIVNSVPNPGGGNDYTTCEDGPWTEGKGSGQQVDYRPLGYEKGLD